MKNPLAVLIKQTIEQFNWVGRLVLSLLSSLKFFFLNQGIRPCNSLRGPFLNFSGKAETQNEVI